MLELFQGPMYSSSDSLWGPDPLVGILWISGKSNVDVTVLENN